MIRDEEREREREGGEGERDGVKCYEFWDCFFRRQNEKLNERKHGRVGLSRLDCPWNLFHAAIIRLLTQASAEAYLRRIDVAVYV